MKFPVYLLGGNIKNHIWKLVCGINSNGDFVEDAKFKFIDESNDNYYGLFRREKNEDSPIKNGSNSLNDERGIRYDKMLIEWEEPERRHRWNSDSGRNAVMKRWTHIWPRKEKFKFKKMKLCGKMLSNKKSWRIILKIRSDGGKIYSYFEC